MLAAYRVQEREGGREFPSGRERDGAVEGSGSCRRMEGRGELDGWGGG